ncbi:MAG TPA: PDZ domain-containing protein [Saprospiraceae bacterium]|nr:PDZ domain-containing protein [Saprospiraceae bacterium]
MTKSRTLLLSSLLGFFGLAFTNQISAQANTQGETIIIQKVRDDNGQVVVKKKRISSGENIQAIVEKMGLNDQNAQNVEVQIVTSGQNAENHTSVMTEPGDETIIWVRQAVEPGDENSTSETFHLTMKGDGESLKKDFEQHWKHKMEKQEPRPLLGIYPGGYAEGKGLEIDGIVEGKGAQAAGMQAGDILVSVNGKSTKSVGQLQTALSEFKPGDNVSAVYLRDGKEIQTTVKLSENRSFYYNSSFERDPCKVFIGIYTSNASEGGVQVTGIIPNTPADISGVRKGDRILALDGVRVNSHESLLAERNKHQPGDMFNLYIVRDGAEQIVEAQFKSCDQKEPEKVEEAVKEVEVIAETDIPAEIPENPLQLEEFTAFPNPTFGAVTVTFKGEAVPTKFRVSDVNGKVIYEENVPGFDGYYNKQLQLGNAMPGNLTLTVFQEGKLQSKQILLLNRA